MSTPSEVAGTLYRYRWLVFELVLRDLRLRYRGSILGFAWTLLNPVLFLLVYTLVFSVYMKVNIQHFMLYLFAGFVPWTWLSSAVSMGASSIVDGRMYVGKSLFPTEVLVVVPVLAAGINFILSLPLVFVFALAYHVNVNFAWLAIPILTLIELLIVQGLVLFIATINVFYRDIQQLVLYVLTLGFFMTPIFYTPNMVPERYHFLIDSNPMAPIIFGFQDIFYRGAFPDAGSLVYPLFSGAVLLALAHGVFHRYREAFSQYI